jgi:uncharacterized protein (DUF362 family)
MARFVKPGQRVVLKPNLSFAAGPERASNTHPQVVAAVSRACMEAGAERVLGLDYPLQTAEMCYQRSGVPEA